MNALPLVIESDSRVLVINNGSMETPLKIIADTLCLGLGGGYLPFEDFVNTHYLDLVAKAYLRMPAEAK
jgi:hypothetical protein